MTEHPIVIQEELLFDKNKNPIRMPRIPESSFVREDFKTYTGKTYEEKEEEAERNNQEFFEELKHLDFKEFYMGYEIH